MAIASYFNKNLLALNQLLKSDNDTLLRIISDKVIGLAFDDNAVSSAEGLAALDLAIRLLARFYPQISVIDASGKHEDTKQKLITLARNINDKIDILPQEDPVDSLLIAGRVNTSELSATSKDGIKVYFGSAGWNAKISIHSPSSFSDSTNPFGAGAAACLATSILFRHVFRDFLGDLSNLPDLNFSVFHLNAGSSTNPTLGRVVLDDVMLVGLGAIGNGCVWALRNIPTLNGMLYLVDGEEIDDVSNPQRYVMVEEKHVGLLKVTAATAFFRQPGLSVIPEPKSWAEYMAVRNDWRLNCVAVAVDNKKDRIGIQGSLPRVIFNSFTEPEVIGISRHLNFLDDACLACGYIPTEKTRNYINEVADNLGIPGHAEMIKDYLNNDKPADDPLLNLIAQANGIDVAAIQHFLGVHIPKFYSEFVCGGILLSLSGNGRKSNDIDAPLAFQSALAGILLAAEIVKFCSGYTNISSQRTDLYPLQSIGATNPLNRPLLKDLTGRCLCRDEDFRSVYRRKWNL